VFELNTGKILEEFNVFLDISSNDYPSFIVNPDTLKWWLKTDANLLNSIINNKDSVSYDIASKKLYEFLKAPKGEVSYLWGNGATFDNVIIEDFLSYSEFKYPIHYTNDRDYRTLVSMAAIKKGISYREYQSLFERKNIQHNAFDDVVHQVEVLSTAYREVMGDAEVGVD